MRRLLVYVAGLVVAVLVAIAIMVLRTPETGLPAMDPDDPRQVAEGQINYARHCASCHGANLEGEPDWRERKASGRLPAPPHDDSGHTWHHSDDQLFGLTKDGLGPYAPAGYESDMPAFAGILTDEEIASVLAFIKSRWSRSSRLQQEQITAQSRREGGSP